ncbi:hypothetical protein AB6A40_000587 [Gnathostoma spinigerum]|uniref:sn-1-specific diacylglycerol lipase ABHD11 n=1 Tax=Gnathostoma spinigerum TaxID=75299 RepID=A0ABD6E2G8_9BILA
MSSFSALEGVRCLGKRSTVVDKCDECAADFEVQSVRLLKDSLPSERKMFGSGRFSIVAPLFARSQLFSNRSLSSALPLAYTKYANKDTDYQNPPLVILHGLFGQRTNWNSMSKALNHKLNCAVFSVDLRNHGDSPWSHSMDYPSMAMDLSLFLEKTVREEMVKVTPEGSDIPSRPVRVHLLGHSMGGKVAMHFSLLPRAKDNLKSLIIEDTAPRIYDSVTHKRYPNYVKAMKEADLAGKSRREIAEQLSSTVYDEKMRQLLLMNLETNSKGHYRWKLNLEGIGRNLSEIFGIDMPSGVYSGPCLFVSGGISPYVAVQDRPSILERFPKAEFKVIEGGGHWVHFDQPDQFLHVVHHFISSLS